MRAREVLGVLLFILLVSCAAAWADGPEQAPSSSYKLFLFQSHPPAARQFSFPADRSQKFTLPKAGTIYIVPFSGRAVRGPLSPSGAGCYTMRTYIVAREGNSDSTRPSGYQECLPANRVQVRNADRNVQVGVEGSKAPEQ